MKEWCFQRQHAPSLLAFFCHWSMYHTIWRKPFFLENTPSKKCTISICAYNMFFFHLFFSISIFIVKFKDMGLVLIKAVPLHAIVWTNTSVHMEYCGQTTKTMICFKSLAEDGEGAFYLSRSMHPTFYLATNEILLILLQCLSLQCSDLCTQSVSFYENHHSKCPIDKRCYSASRKKKKKNPCYYNMLSSSSMPRFYCRENSQLLLSCAVSM